MKKFLVSYLAVAFAAGMMISIGGFIYLICSIKYLGAALFSLGLYTIIQYRLTLFTGKVGYIATKGVKYIPDVLVILIGNCIGTFTCAMLFRQTRFGDILAEKAAASMETKFGDSLLSSFILAIFCGLLMYIAVENSAMSKKTNSDTSTAVCTILCVMVFIICGFNHCIADMFYFFVSGKYTTDALIYFPVVILGNSVGGMTLPVIQKLGLLHATKE